MKFLGILRASALFILVSAFRGPRGVFCSNLKVDPSNESFTVEVSEDHEDSTVESSSQSGLVFESSEWDVSQLASAVFFLEEFCQEVRADAFSGRLVEDLYDGLKEPCLRVSYYARSYTDHFRPRNLLDGPYKDALKPEMFQHYVEWLVENIPGITGSLELMFNEFKGLSEKQLESAISVVLTSYGFEFHDVWTDKDFISSLRHKTSNLVNALKSLHGSLGKIHSDSFRNPLTEAQSDVSKNNEESTVEPQVAEDALEESSKVNESDIAENHEDYTVKSKSVENPKDSTVESSSELSSPAPKSNLVFENSKWDDSMLASTFLFLEEFCEDVMAEKFGGKVSEGLSKACVNVSSYMGSFIHRFKPTYGPGTVNKRKEIPMNFYKDVLKAEQFEVYAKWLVKNIPVIRVSLKHMYYEALKLSEKQLNEFSSYGPPKYGFVYTGYWWGELTHGVSRGFFGSNTILESLKDLKSSLDDILGNSITSKVFSLFSREKKSDVNSQQENSTVKSQAA
ncbi:secreted antigen 1 [Babesia divergens]|uniref:Secreted antigen 1 n=1 Tax=Babesia divergens TaxID=32595 RepID=A0AAD9GIH1_BABDI|nr:secreted antigen 1 [Babesia divergens]